MKRILAELWLLAITITIAIGAFHVLPLKILLGFGIGCIFLVITAWALQTITEV